MIKILGPLDLIHVVFTNKRRGRYRKGLQLSPQICQMFLFTQISCFMWDSGIAILLALF